MFEISLRRCSTDLNHFQFQQLGFNKFIVKIYGLRTVESNLYNSHESVRIILNNFSAISVYRGPKEWEMTPIKLRTMKNNNIDNRPHRILRMVQHRGYPKPSLVLSI